MKEYIHDAYEFGYDIVGPLLIEKRYRISWRMLKIYTRSQTLQKKQDKLDKKWRKLRNDKFDLQYEIVVTDILERYPI